MKSVRLGASIKSCKTFIHRFDSGPRLQHSKQHRNFLTRLSLSDKTGEHRTKRPIHLGQGASDTRSDKINRLSKFSYLTLLARIGPLEHSRMIQPTLIGRREDGEPLFGGAKQTETGQLGGRSQNRCGSWQEADRSGTVRYEMTSHLLEEA